jgi:hypothetical protein
MRPRGRSLSRLAKVIKEFLKHADMIAPRFALAANGAARIDRS